MSNVIYYSIVVFTTFLRVFYFGLKAKNFEVKTMDCQVDKTQHF